MPSNLSQKNKRPRFTISFHLIELTNLPQLAGSCHIKWQIKDSASAPLSKPLSSSSAVPSSSGSANGGAGGRFFSGGSTVTSASASSIAVSPTFASLVDSKVGSSSNGNSSNNTNYNSSMFGNTFKGSTAKNPIENHRVKFDTSQDVYNVKFEVNKKLKDRFIQLENKYLILNIYSEVNPSASTNSTHHRHHHSYSGNSAASGVGDTGVSMSDNDSSTTASQNNKNGHNTNSTFEAAAKKTEEIVHNNEKKTYLGQVKINLVDYVFKNFDTRNLRFSNRIQENNFSVDKFLLQESKINSILSMSVKLELTKGNYHDFANLRYIHNGVYTPPASSQASGTLGSSRSGNDGSATNNANSDRSRSSRALFAAKREHLENDSNYDNKSAAGSNKSQRHKSRQTSRLQETYISSEHSSARNSFDSSISNRIGNNNIKENKNKDKNNRLSLNNLRGATSQNNLCINNNNNNEISDSDDTSSTQRSRNSIASPTQGRPAYQNTINLEENSNINNVGIITDLYYKTFKVQWDERPNEFNPKECIDDIFDGGNGWKRTIDGANLIDLDYPESSGTHNIYNNNFNNNNNIQNDQFGSHNDNSQQQQYHHSPQRNAGKNNYDSNKNINGDKHQRDFHSLREPQTEELRSDSSDHELSSPNLTLSMPQHFLSNNGRNNGTRNGNGKGKDSSDYNSPKNDNYANSDYNNESSINSPIMENSDLDGQAQTQEQLQQQRLQLQQMPFRTRNHHHNTEPDFESHYRRQSNHPDTYHDDNYNNNSNGSTKSKDNDYQRLRQRTLTGESGLRESRDNIQSWKVAS